MLPPAGNPGLAAAVAAFAREPSRATRLHVLRWCLHGSLLVDAVGAPANGPDGEGAMVAFTTARDRDVREQPSVAVLESVVAEGHGWLLLDPDGHSCALTRHDIEFALLGERNDLVRAALGGHRTGDTDARVAEALAAGGWLVLGVDPASIGGRGAGVRLRSAQAPDGGAFLLAFTSAAEAASRHATDSFASRPVEQVLGMVVDGPYAGLVINPSGPSAALPGPRCRDVLERLAG